MIPVDIDGLDGLPAPYWFIQLFKGLGFILHSIPMHLWLAGLPIAIFLLIVGGANAQVFARRLLKQMPVIMAFGINFGIVPLLFIQVAYSKVFYPATILMAWHWLGILIMVLPAYYLLYITSGLVDSGKKWWPALTGSIASFLIICVGLIFASAWTLMANPDAWSEIWRTKSIAGAATGLGTNWSDSVVFLRFISIAGLAILTVTFWALFDTWFLFIQKKAKKSAAASSAEPAAPKQKQVSQITDFMDNPHLSPKRKRHLQQLRSKGKLSEEEELEALEYGFDGEADDDADEEQEEAALKKAAKSGELPDISDISTYQRWIMRFAETLVWFGIFISLGSLWFYYYKVLDGTPNPEIAAASASSVPDDFIAVRIIPIWIPIVTFIAILSFAVVLMLGSFKKLEGKLLVVLLGLCHAVILIFFTTTRQVIQNSQIASYLDVRSIPVKMQLSPILVFLLIFLFGAALIYWMVSTMAKAARK